MLLLNLPQYVVHGVAGNVCLSADMSYCSTVIRYRSHNSHLACCCLQTIWQDWMLKLTSLLLEGDDNGNSSDAVGTSRKHATSQLRSRTVYRDATGRKPATGGQLASCILDVDRNSVTIKETISCGQHCVVRASNFCKHYKAWHIWLILCMSHGTQISISQSLQSYLHL